MQRPRRPAATAAGKGDEGGMARSGNDMPRKRFDEHEVEVIIGQFLDRLCSESSSGLSGGGALPAVPAFPDFAPHGSCAVPSFDLEAGDHDIENVFRCDWVSPADSSGVDSGCSGEVPFMDAGADPPGCGHASGEACNVSICDCQRGADAGPFVESGADPPVPPAPGSGLRLSTSMSGGERISLDEYVGRNSGERFIFYLPCAGLSQAVLLSGVGVFRQMGVEVLYLLDPADERALLELGEFGGKQLKSMWGLL